MSKAKALITKYFREVYENRNFNLLDDIIHPDYYFNQDDVFGIPLSEKIGIAGVKSRVKYYLNAFPDAKFDIITTVEQGDLIVVQYFLTATHEGIFQGMNATGKKIAFKAFQQFRIKDDQIIQSELIYDSFKLFSQIGAAIMKSNQASEIEDYIGLIKSWANTAN